MWQYHMFHSTIRCVSIMSPIAPYATSEPRRQLAHLAHEGTDEAWQYNLVAPHCTSVPDTW
eukprot:3938377-Rhodomonas_salina.4